MIESCEIRKCSLSCFDNKRFIREDGIITLVYGQATWLTFFVGKRQPMGKGNNGGKNGVCVWGGNLVD